MSEAGGAGARAIYYALLLFFVFDYVRPGAYIPGLDALRLNALIPIVAILGTLVTRTAVSNQQFFAEPNTRILGVLLGLLAVSTVFATVTMTAYTVTKTVFAYLLIYWILVRHIGDYARLKGVFMTLTLVHIMIAVLNPAMFTNPESRVGINSGAFLGDGNDFALSVNVCIPLCLFVLLESKSKIMKGVWAGALLTLVLCVVLTKSRGGTLALASIGLYYWWKSPRKAMAAAVVVLVLAVVLAVAPSSYFTRMSMMTDTEEGSAQGRIIAWKAGVKMALANPILGAGAGHFPLAYGVHYHVEGTPWLTAHSIYFLLLGELGLPGLIVLVVFIFSNLKANRQLLRVVDKLPRDRASTARNALACTSAALVAYASGGAFLSAAYYPHMYVLAGLLVAARHVTRLEIASHEQADRGGMASDDKLEKRAFRPTAISPEWRPSRALAAGQRG